MDNYGPRYQRATRFAEIVSSIVRSKIANAVPENCGVISDPASEAINLYEIVLIDSLVENGAVIWPCGEERVECSSSFNETPE